MHASIVFFAALVAVAAGQYWGMHMPLNPVLGVPFDTPEVMHEKHFHAVAHANAAARSGLLLRKRREAPEAEHVNADSAPVAPVTAEDTKEKRQILLSGYGYYPGYYPFGSMWYRKKRDTSEVSAEEQSPAEETKEKRQILLSGYGYYPGYYPFGSMWYRKKRDTSEMSAEEQSPAEETKEKRQILLGGYGGYYSGYYPFGSMWYRKKRDTSEMSPESPAAEETKDKRQILLSGYGYYPYGRYYSGYPVARMGWYRKKRDASEMSPEEQSPAAEETKDKRQIIYSGYGYGGYYGYPLARSMWW